MGARTEDPGGEVFRDLVDGIQIALAVVRLVDPGDPCSLTIVAANPAARSLLAFDDTVPGSRLVDVLAISEDLLAELAGLVGTDRPHAASSVEVDGLDGTFSLQFAPLPGGCIGISIEDVTSRTLANAELRHRATHDDLTGLANRVLLNERLTDALVEADRTGNRVALLLVDLDQFKEVNDALGHECGDALLRELAQRMQQRLRACDTVARLGGDEFAVLLRTDVTVDAAEDVARRITALAAEPVHLDRSRLQISASVGVAIAPDHGADAESLLRRADAAMYEAKSVGGNHISFCGRGAPASRRLGLLADIRGRGFASELEVLFQPRVELRGMTTVGVEALARWQHPHHGLLEPREFIYLAEVSGSMRILTEAVTARALAVLDGVAATGLQTASINISPRNLVDPEWVESTCRTLDDAALEPGRLWMELTEEQLMEDPRQSVPVLERLHAAGVRFSIDDFGSGASSLALVRDLPVDEVKIDRRFVDDLRDGDDRIVRSIIDLGHNLGLGVTAEGVADIGTVETLRSMGCDLAQGWALAAPMPLEDLSAHLRTGPEEDAAVTWKAPVTHG